MNYLLLLPIVGFIWFLLWFFASDAKAQEIRYQVPQIPCEVSIPKLKAMIRAVENTPWDFIGLAGERSSYSILEDTWKMWSLRPFTWASSYEPMCQKETELVVSKHLAYIKGVLRKKGYTQTPYTVACIWKGGEARWAAHKLRFVDTEYAKRAMNLYFAVNQVTSVP